METRFGKFTKKLRIENDELMVDMAKKLNISKSFLSQLESGVRKPPKKLEEKIRAEYTLNKLQLEELRESMFVTLNKECIDISSYKENEKDVIYKLFIKMAKDTSIIKKIDNMLKVS